MSVAARRYTATDHKSFDQSLKHCPAGAFCRNCMPINDTADHCWAVKTPILYKVKSYGKIESKNKGDIVSHIAVSLHYSGILSPCISVAYGGSWGPEWCMHQPEFLHS